MFWINGSCNQTCCTVLNVYTLGASGRLSECLLTTPILDPNISLLRMASKHIQAVQGTSEPDSTYESACVCVQPASRAQHTFQKFRLQFKRERGGKPNLFGINNMQLSSTYISLLSPSQMSQRKLKYQLMIYVRGNLKETCPLHGQGKEKAHRLGREDDDKDRGLHCGDICLKA